MNNTQKHSVCWPKGVGVGEVGSREVRVVGNELARGSLTALEIQSICLKALGVPRTEKALDVLKSVACAILRPWKALGVT